MPESYVAINDATFRPFGPFDSYNEAHEWVRQVHLACARTAGFSGRLPKFEIRLITSPESTSAHDIL